MIEPKVYFPYLQEDGQKALDAYRKLRGKPGDWLPPDSDMLWAWFKIGWDAKWIEVRE